MCAMYADVIVDITSEKLDRSFQYRIPTDLAGEVCEGSQVRIPFGNGGRVIDGYVLGVSDKPKIDETKIKEIDSLVKNGVTVEGKLMRLAAWIRETYGSTMVQAIKTVLPVRKERSNKRDLPDITGEGESAAPAELTPEQRRVRDGILAEWEEKDRPCLIRGITGSGKTHVYLELIDRVLAESRQAIVLIPEISLTWQTVRRFTARFGDRVALLHSRQTQAERKQQTARIRSGEAQIVIGPRSALFAPVPNLGLIVMDEEHETSYISEKTPRYHTRETAEARAHFEGAHLVLGSATPSVDARFRCELGDYALFALESRYGDAALPEVQIVDLREELDAGNRSALSRALQEGIEDRLARGEQVLLFLNRRGHTGFLSCRACGHVMKCPHCDVSLTSHRGGRLICHYCGYETPTVSTCPSCGSGYIKGFQVGTEKVEQEVEKLFPEARILRMDADSTKKRGSYEEILSRIGNREADILIGTQMIVKGHDFPGITLVGVIAADLSLFASDYRSAERTYQLLVQAVGRAGRGDRPGEAIIQTYHPEHYSICAAAEQDYESFYEEEIAGREMMGYPPSAALLAVHAAGKDEAELDLAMDYLCRYARRLAHSESTAIIGPAPEAVSKVRDSYRRVLYLKETNMAECKRLRAELERYIEINSGFDNLQIQYDVETGMKG